MEEKELKKDGGEEEIVSWQNFESAENKMTATCGKIESKRSDKLTTMQKSNS